MILYPAIDVFGGKVVRLRQGEYDDSTVYGVDPVAMALSFVDQGATWVHMVDLDAARSGEPVNRFVIAAVASAIAGRASLQVGGGVRTEADAEALATAGVTRVVMGSAAVADPALVARVSGIVSVAVGLDHRNGVAATHGWTESDVEGLARAVSQTSIPVIASGGVGTLSHIAELAAVIGLNGVIVGKALYESKFSVSEALAALS
jgi:phosphoribosylformimino-5-aminoimidazole carboxamide ribotide isomerase